MRCSAAPTGTHPVHWTSAATGGIPCTPCAAAGVPAAPVVICLATIETQNI